MSDEMPVFVIKAKDRLAIKAVLAYQALCEDEGLSGQAVQVGLAIHEMMMWRGRNENQVKNPDHKHVPAQRKHPLPYINTRTGLAHLGTPDSEDLLADGREVRIAEYPKLFEIIRNMVEVDNEAGTFKLPDFITRVVKQESLTMDEMPTTAPLTDNWS